MTQQYPTLAEQALRIYDDKGEWAMLTFVMTNARPTETSEQRAMWTEYGSLLLDDGSDLIHGQGEYKFGWGGRRIGRQARATRPAMMPASGRPDIPDLEPQPLISWPNIDDAWHRLMERLAPADDSFEESREVNMDTTCQAAPSLYPALRQAVSASRTGRFVEKYYDDIVATVADKAWDLLDPTDHERLAAMTQPSDDPANG